MPVCHCSGIRFQSNLSRTLSDYLRLCSGLSGKRHFQTKVCAPIIQGIFSFPKKVIGILRISVSPHTKVDWNLESTTQELDKLRGTTELQPSVSSLNNYNTQVATLKVSRNIKNTCHHICPALAQDTGHRKLSITASYNYNLSFYTAPNPKLTM